jgi:hypothetical protein
MIILILLLMIYMQQLSILMIMVGAYLLLYQNIKIMNIQYYLSQIMSLFEINFLIKMIYFLILIQLLHQNLILFI